MRFLNPGALVQYRKFPKWDALLYFSSCNRYSNAELTITLKLFLEKVDPPGGITGSVYPDYDKNPKYFVPWGSYFNIWKQNFKLDVEKAWHGKFWLKCSDTFDKWDFEDKHMIYRPNIWCRFKVELVGSPAAAHARAKCVRLDSAERSFRSDSGHYTDRDINPEPRSHGSPFRTSVHEIGHLLGLKHVGVEGPPSVSRTICRIQMRAMGPSAAHTDICYGAIGQPGRRDVMGTGGDIRSWHAKPWQEAVAWFSGRRANEWIPDLQRYYPRSVLEIGLPGKGWHTSRPNRL